ncbi:MAG: transglycosylase SLT domain-containing protein [Bdellovibrionota bacterium]
MIINKKIRKLLHLNIAGFSLFAVYIAFLPVNASATMLMEDYPLNEAVSSASQEVDSGLSEWLTMHADKNFLLDEPSQEVEKVLSKEDATTRAYVKLLLARKSGENEKAKTILDSLIKKIKLSLNNPTRVEHPLTPYIIEEYLKDHADVQSGELDMLNIFSGTRQNSCPHKSYVESKLGDSKTLTNAKNINILLSQVQKFRSRQFREKILREFLPDVPVNLRKKVVEEVWPIAKDTPYLLKRFPWIATLSANDLGIEGKFSKVSYASRRGHCETARNNLISIFRNEKNLDINEAHDAALQVGNCAKRKGAQKRIEYWISMIPYFEDIFGTSGWAVANMEIARFQWTLDKFELAKKILKDVIARTEKEKDDEFLAKATLILAQVYEDKNEEDLAIELYESYRNRFPKSEMINKALSTLLLAYVGRGDWEKALVPARQIIKSQDDLPIDQREVSILGFALFWQGRSYLELKNNEFAQASFKRLVKEFYSTYYGAIGQYLLEQMGGSEWALKSGPSIGFAKDEWYRKFSKTDQLRSKRIELLLRLGMKEKAICEISELDIKEVAETSLVKSLFLHAAGNWLGAIKEYSNLPRSFRHSLPYGMERVLFPKKFESDIKEYAGRLGLDANFIFALIRQESVFNPLARSPAGARGLMQLMPQTASLEAKKIKSPYVSSKVRRNILARTRKSNSLFDANTNLLLGTHHLHRLLENYDSPVFTLSAYNAGPAVAAKWKGEFDTTDLLYVIERIPYKETRGYVKLILRNYFYYSRWYGGGKDKPLPHLRKVMESLLAGGDAPAKQASTLQ